MSAHRCCDHMEDRGLQLGYCEGVSYSLLIWGRLMYSCMSCMRGWSGCLVMVSPVVVFTQTWLPMCTRWSFIFAVFVFAFSVVSHVFAHFAHGHD